MVAGAATFLRQSLAPAWSEAEQLGLVSGEPADAISAAIVTLYVKAGLSLEPEPAGRARKKSSAGDQSRGVRRVDVSRVFRYTRQVMRDSAVQLQAEYDAGFLARAEETLHKAALERWGRERFASAIERLADEYGAAGFQSAHAATWYRTAVLNSGYNQGLLLGYNSEPTRRLFPFLAYRTAGDDRVRSTHRALDGFVAPTNWPGWRSYTPPLGWNCRCRLVPVGYAVARELGWLGTTFPRGDHFVRVFEEDAEILLPGADPGFVPPVQLLPGFLPFA